MRNKTGKALTIFLVLIAIILISLTAISVFLMIKQVQLRESAEYNFAQLQTSEGTLRIELEQVKKENSILEQKSKEAESKVEELLQELDLAEGVRDEVKNENKELKDSLEVLKVTNKEVSDKLASKEVEIQTRVTELQQQLDAALVRNKELEAQRQELEKEYETLKTQLSTGAEVIPNVMGLESKVEDVNVDLKKIVVSAEDSGQGQVVSVDQEAEFVIVNMGERHGVSVDAVLSIYDNEKYLGDIVVTRVLPEMSAADFVAPLTSQGVSKGNLVKVKE